MNKKIFTILMALTVLLGGVANAQTFTKQVNKQFRSINQSKQNNGIKTCNSSISLVTTSVDAATTVDLTFTYTHSSPDAEWVDGISLQFPAGVTVNSASGIPSTSPKITYNGEVGDGALATWGDIVGGSGLGSLYVTGTFTLNVTISPSMVTDITIPWYIAGDGYGSAPHSATGNLTITVVPSAGADITFTVSEAIKGLIEGATVIIEGQSYTTDATGSVTAYLLVGDNAYTISKFGYADATGSVTVVDGVNQTIPVELSKLPTYNVLFAVTDIANTPIDGATITIYDGTTALPSQTTAMGLTQFQIPNGTYTYDVVATGFGSKLAQPLVVDGADVPISITLTEPMTDPFGLLIEVLGNSADFSWNNIIGLESFVDGFEDGTFAAWDEYIQGTGTPGTDNPNPFWLCATPDGGTAPEGSLVAHADWGYTIDTWLITPVIAATATTTLTFQFNTSLNWMVTQPNGDILVKVSTDGGTTWTQVWREEDFGTFVDWAWNTVTVDLSSYAGQGIKVAFNLVANDNANVEIDAVNISSVSTKTASNKTTRTKTASNKSAKALTGYAVYLDANLIGTTATTDEFFNFTDLASGSYLAGVKALYSTGESNLVTIPFDIVPGGNCTFIVSDAATEPNLLEGATVNIDGVDSLTNASGEFSMYLTAGVHVCTISKFGYTTLSENIIVSDGISQELYYMLDILSTYDVTFNVSNITPTLLQDAKITIYLGTDIVNTGNTIDGKYIVNLPVGSYTFDVELAGYITQSGLALDVVSSVVTKDITLYEDMQQVTGFEVSVNGLDADLSWYEPGHIFQWIHYDDEATAASANALGLTNGGEVYAAAYFPASDLTQFQNGTLSKIKFFAGAVAVTNSTFTIKIWKGAGIVEDYTQAVTSYIPDAWNEITLTTPYQIDATQDLYIGYSCVMDVGEFPCGIDAGPAVAGFGDLASFDGGATWKNLSTYGFGNFSIQGYVDAPAPVATKDFLATYNVYLDGVKQNSAPISALTYSLPDLSTGVHDASITSLYATGESEKMTKSFTIFAQIGLTYSVVNPDNGTLEAAIGTTAVASGVSVDEGSDITFTAKPANGYKVKEWKNGVAVVPDNVTNTYILTNITSPSDVTVEFTPITYTITYNVIAGNGSLSATVVGGAPIVTGDPVNIGSNVEFTASPNSGYVVKQWKKNSVIVAGVTGTTYSITNVTGPTAVSVEFKLAVGLNELNSGVNVYPNPSSGLFNITVDGTYTANVTDVTGKVVYTKVINTQNNTLDLTSQEAGIYFIQLQGEKTYNLKVVVK